MAQRYRKTETCWTYRSGLEKILIVSTALAFILILILLILVILQINSNKPQTQFYLSPPLTNDNSEIKETVDPSVDPCDDFYNFACGNLLKRAQGDETMGPFFVLQQKAKNQLRELYSEDLDEARDHKIVTFSKKLYRACMNESAIRREEIGDLLRAAGGWPVVEGIKWDEANFSWMALEKRLRELGGFYFGFLGVTITHDPLLENKFILKVGVPEARTFKIPNLKNMVDVALKFGAAEGRALVEMAETHVFMLEALKELDGYQSSDVEKRTTPQDFHESYNFVNWVDFINNITGPSVQISKDDFVLFASGRVLRDWFAFLLKTPKRILANYMMWRVVEDLAPYVADLQKWPPPVAKSTFANFDERSDFCALILRERLTPNPLDLMYVRRRLPKSKRAEIKAVIKSLQEELEPLAQNFDVDQKEAVLKRIRTLRVVVGAPDEFLDDDEVFDDLFFDFGEEEDDGRGGFLDLLLKLNRNRVSWIFNQMYTPWDDFKLTKWSLRTQSVIGGYSSEDNVINLPATIFQDTIFDEKRPNYFNFGSMGTVMGHHFFYVLSEPPSLFDGDGNVMEGSFNFSAKPFGDVAACLATQIENFDDRNLHAIDLILHQALGLKVSYEAYKKRAEKEDYRRVKLTLSEYTNKQLFWISAASYYCQPLSPSEVLIKSPEESKLFSLLVTVPILNAYDFAKDFFCKIGTKMNPVEKCLIF